MRLYIKSWRFFLVLFLWSLLLNFYSPLETKLVAQPKYLDDAPWILVSDIDDTLKITHAEGNPEQLISGALKVRNNSFLGMNELLSLSVCGERICQTPVAHRPVHYVTAAPGFISKLGKKLLRNDEFPKGKVHARGFFNDTVQFKSETISGILRAQGLASSGLRKVIMLGDDGQYDSLAYGLATEGMPAGWDISMYIHSLYSHGLEYQNQNMYLTVIDLAFQFYREGLIDQFMLQYFFEIYLPIYQNPALPAFDRLLPYWVDCSAFVSYLEQLPIENLPNTWVRAKWVDYILYTDEYCSS